MYEVIVGYIVGTIATLVLFHMTVREYIVASTLDMLIRDGFLRSYIDDDGITQLVKYYEMTEDELDRNLERVRRIIEDIEAEENEDDTP